MSLNFEKCGNECESFLHELSEKLGYAYESQRTIEIVKCVLFTIRDHLEFDESRELLAQLPIFLKPVYVENWVLTEKKKLNNLNHFLEEVREKDGSHLAEFNDDQKILAAIKMVFLVLRKYVSEEEMDEILAILPKEINACMKMIFCNACGILNIKHSPPNLQNISTPNVK